MKKLAFICRKGLETFIEPVIKEFEQRDKYQVRRYYIQTQQEIIAAIKWSDHVFLEWANEITIFASQVYELKKKGVIVRLHSYEALSGFASQIDWSRVDYLTFVAPHIREIVRKDIPDLDDKVFTSVIPNGVPEDTPLLTDPSVQDIAMVCNINHKKAPELALQIISELSGRDKTCPYRLHIAGTNDDPRYKIYLEHMARSMGIEDNILYYGFVMDMEAFWQGKGYILSTSIHEGHPLNIIEGAMRGLRPVIHNFYGAEELYPYDWLYNTVSEAGDIFEPRSANTMHAMREQDEWMPANIRDYVIEQGWTLENQVNQIEALVDKLEVKEDDVEETDELDVQEEVAESCTAP